MKIQDLLATGRLELADQRSNRLESEILLCEALGVSRAWLYANSEQVIEPRQADRYLDLTRQRQAGQPIAYLTGHREFWSLRLKVNTDVLIPRPETELLVETALELVPPDASWRIADLGTGSGAIALAIASERPLCEIHATDSSQAALEVARENVQILAPDRVSLFHGSWLEPLDGKFDLIVSNPPYIAENDLHLLIGDCRFEPPGALVAGHDGLDAFGEITRQAVGYLEPGGVLAFEHGYDQGKRIRSLFENSGYTAVVTKRDIESRERVTSGIWK
ncbi:MAG: peptide chain release factor N(5)-glutamine methyltransferase [Proteobacteria bacterium]|nr:peptide chain release factor N(5)-glutamine methyltransferase [Pseudomonadota bacterium]